MESIKDFFQSIFDNYTERIKSPLIGSFILSFAIYNWRPISILFFSNWPIHCRIEWIDEKYCIWTGIVIPLLISLFYIMLLPYINLFFEWVLERYSNEKFLKKNKLRLQNLNQQKQEAVLKREIADAEAGTSEINNLKLRNDSLLKEIENLTEQNKNDISRHTAIIETSKQAEDLLKNDISILKTENEDVKKTLQNILSAPTYMELPNRTVNFINNLTVEERKYYIAFCNFRIFKTATAGIIDEEKLKKFIEMGLLIPIRIEANSFEITEFGIIVYNYLVQQNKRF